MAFSTACHPDMQRPMAMKNSLVWVMAKTPKKQEIEEAPTEADIKRGDEMLRRLESYGSTIQ